MRLIRIALVEEPAELAVLGRRHAGVVQRDDLPLVVEHRRAGGARLGVGGVVQVAVGDVDDLVLAQRDLLLLAARVLHDRHELADDRLALGLDQPVVAERRRAAPASRATATSAKSRSSSARKKRSGSSWNTARQRLAVDAVLEVELDHAAARGRGVGQHVVVREQQRGGDERAGAEAAAGRAASRMFTRPTARAAVTPASR